MFALFNKHYSANLMTEALALFTRVHHVKYHISAGKWLGIHPLNLMQEPSLKSDLFGISMPSLKTKKQPGQ